MKKIAVICIAVSAVFISSCTVFVFNEDDRGKKDSSDSVTVTVVRTSGAVSP